MAALGITRELTKPEKDFVESLRAKIKSLKQRIATYPVAKTYNTAAAWTVFGWAHDIVVVLTEALSKTAQKAKLAKYQDPIVELENKLWEDWKGSPYIEPYQRAMVKAGAASTTRSPDPLVTFPDENFLRTILAKLDSIEKFAGALYVMWSLSGSLDSQDMLYEMSLSLNKIFKEAAKNVGDMGKALVRGSATALGEVLTTFMKKLWKPALVIGAAILVYKKVDRAEIGPFKGAEDAPRRRR